MKSVSILILAILLTGCGIFDTRNPESPSQTSSNYLPPTEPSIVFTNMSNSFRDINSLNYLRSFADSATAARNYSFEPTSQARLRYGAVFAGWTRQSELQFFENTKSKLQSGKAPTLEFLTLTAQSIQSDSAQYEATYQLTIPHTQSTVAQVAHGRALFSLVADKSRNWVVWRWVDIALAQNDFTWSDFKGAFGQ